MDNQLVDKALEECGYDIDSAIKRLQNLSLGSVVEDGVAITDANVFKDNLPSDGGEWVEVLVSEMKSATSVEDAKSRATRVLESLEKSIYLRVGAHKENMLKEQTEVVIRENMILKRAVVIQHERQKERNQEVDQMKQLVAQYQEQLRTLELNNYALTMHLKQSIGKNLTHGYSNPDVF